MYFSKSFFTLLACSSLAVASTTGAKADITLSDADLQSATFKTRTYSGRVSVHDPSIFMDTITAGTSGNPTYYIYGSHLATAKTTLASNYQAWTTFGGGETNSCTLFSGIAANGSVIPLTTSAKAYSVNRTKTVKNYKGEEVPLTFDAEAWHKAGNTTNVWGNEWAPDIIYNKKLGKWFMYMSLNGDRWASVICAFSSTTPTGRWIYEGPVVMSGFSGQNASCDWKKSDLAIATGCTTLPARYKVADKWGTYWPNCIDPCVFYDEEGNLWMSYGSWSGGIFIIRLDESTGLRDYTYQIPYQVNGTTVAVTDATAANANCTSDPYFGKKIAGGYYVSGEASYIEHIGKYYYLFMSYGGLEAAGGYQMRVFRSEKPDGPYVDCCSPSGISAIYGSYRLNFGSDANRDMGMKLMGNYKWQFMPNAELAQGHNSAITDHKGRSFVVYHTRFNTGNEGHQVRVHQLFTNEDGWIVAAPYEFSGETQTQDSIAHGETYTNAQILGTYEFIVHKYRQNTKSKEFATPVNITLNADGTVTGAYTGTWSRTAGTDYVTISLKNVLNSGASNITSFKGVMTRQSIDFTDLKALCFTGVSSSSGLSTSAGGAIQTRGLCAWGTNTDPKVAIKYTKDKVSVPFSDGATINSSQKLPVSGLLGADISWTSSDPELLTSTGAVTGKGAGSVTLTMTIAKNGYSYSKSYNLYVDAAGEASVPVFYPESQIKNTASGWWANFSPTYSLSAGSQMQFKFYNHSAAGENYHNWSLYGCKSFVNNAVTGEYFGARCDNWDNTSGSNTGCVSNYNWDTFKSDMDGSLVEMTVSLDANGNFSMESVITTKAGKVYDYSYKKTLSDKPSQITLFFVSEKSYIDTGDLDAVEEVFSEAPAMEREGIYDLQGRRLNALQKGFNVVGGRRILVR